MASLMATRQISVAATVHAFRASYFWLPVRPPYVLESRIRLPVRAAVRRPWTRRCGRRGTIKHAATRRAPGQNRPKRPPRVQGQSPSRCVTFDLLANSEGTYAEGNFIEAGIDTNFFQTGETKYGRPILDCVSVGRKRPNER